VLAATIVQANVLPQYVFRGSRDVALLSRVEYALEVLKGGVIIEKHSIVEKDHYIFGRNPAAEFVLEHPSASRLHAVCGNGDATGPCIKCRAVDGCY
jgi:hypothetical protein